MMTYEVNANGNRTFTSRSAASVASVAAQWLKQGHQPKAYAIKSGDKIAVVEVAVSTAKKTAKSLASA